MDPVVTLKARIVQVREVPRGGTVGYGATWTATRTTRLAILSVGYGDGYLRAASSPRPAPSRAPSRTPNRTPLHASPTGAAPSSAASPWI